MGELQLLWIEPIVMGKAKQQENKAILLPERRWEGGGAKTPEGLTPSDFLHLRT